MNIMIKLVLTILMNCALILAQFDGDTLYTENDCLYHNNFSLLIFDIKDSSIHETTDLAYTSHRNNLQTRSMVSSGLDFEFKINSVGNLKLSDMPTHFDFRTQSNNTFYNYNLQIRKLFSEETRRTFQLINF